MCLIVHRPAAKGSHPLAHIPEAVIDHNRKQNSDGFGLAWREPDGMHFEKYGPKEYSDFYGLLKELDAQNREYVAHFRMATRGAVNRDMAHPFPYEDPTGQPVLVFHNGVIDIKTNPGESDTYAFVKRVLQKLESRWWTKDPLRYLVEQSVGWSRLLVMTAKETVHLNKSDWKQEGGIWYSTYPTSWTGSILGGYYASGGHSSDIKGAKSAATSALVLLPDAPEAPANGWLHMGHPVVPITDEGDSQTEQYGQAVCDVCMTVGEYYVIEGKRYIDLSHAVAEVPEEDPDYILDKVH